MCAFPSNEWEKKKSETEETTYRETKKRDANKSNNTALTLKYLFNVIMSHVIKLKKNAMKKPGLFALAMYLKLSKSI